MFSVVETNYDDPHLEINGHFIKEFMFKILPHFENRKIYHKKYACQIQRFCFSLNNSNLIRTIVKMISLLKSLSALVEIMISVVSVIEVNIHS